MNDGNRAVPAEVSIAVAKLRTYASTVAEQVWELPTGVRALKPAEGTDDAGHTASLQLIYDFLVPELEAIERDRLGPGPQATSLAGVIYDGATLTFTRYTMDDVVRELTATVWPDGPAAPARYSAAAVRRAIPGPFASRLTGIVNVDQTTEVELERLLGSGALRPKAGDAVTEDTRLAVVAACLRTAGIDSLIRRADHGMVAVRERRIQNREITMVGVSRQFAGHGGHNHVVWLRVVTFGGDRSVRWAFLIGQLPVHEYENGLHAPGNYGWGYTQTACTQLLGVSASNPFDQWTLFRSQGYGVLAYPALGLVDTELARRAFAGEQAWDAAGHWNP